MQLTHLGHACLLVEMAGTRILVDPGTLAREWEGLRDLDAVVVTHQHPDHLDVDRLPALLAGNPDVPLVTDPGSADELAAREIRTRPHDQAGLSVGSVRLTPAGELHAVIHDELPQIPNIGVRFEADGEPSLYVPGDALDAGPGPVDVLAFPLNAPWARAREMTAFLRRFDATFAVPVHDGLLSDTGREAYLGHAKRFGGEHTTVRDLAGAGPTRFDPK